jgi:hypothetical protein
MNRQQFHGSDTQILEVLDARRMTEPCIRAAKVLRNVGITEAETLYVRLVDHRVRQRYLRSGIVRPVKRIVNDDRLGHAARAVLQVNFEWVTGSHVVRKNRRPPVNLPGNRFGIRVDQRFRRIEAHPMFGIPRSVHAVVVKLSRLDAVDESVPDKGGPFQQRDAVDFVAVCVVKAHIHAFSAL